MRHKQLQGFCILTIIFDGFPPVNLSYWYFQLYIGAILMQMYIERILNHFPIHLMDFKSSLLDPLVFLRCQLI